MQKFGLLIILMVLLGACTNRNLDSFNLSSPVDQSEGSAASSPAHSIQFNSIAASPTGSDIYIAQNAMGNGSGSDCSNTRAYSFFNSSSNWGSGAGQIAPGTIVHICGTITGNVGANGLTFQGGGTSGRPITLYFEPGAALSAAAWGDAIHSDGNTYLVVDGGANGVIQNTLNGSPGGSCPGGSCKYQQEGAGVSLNNCSNCLVQNLSIADFYDHVSGDENGPTSGIYLGGATNVTLNNIVIHDAAYCIFDDMNVRGTTNLTVSNNDLSRCSTNLAIAGGSGSSGTLSGAFIYGNSIHDDMNWNDPNYSFHHDGIHIWSYPGTNVSNIQVYNNNFHGDMGQATAFMYFENYSSSVEAIQIFNNIFTESTTTCGFDCGPHALWLQTDVPASVLQAKVYNNTFAGSGHMGAITVEGSSGIQYDLQNNIAYGWTWLLDIQPGAPRPQASDYNDWYDLGNGAQGINDENGGSYNTLSSWQSATGLDAHSIASNPSLSSSFLLQSGSPAIGKGINLSSMGIGALNSDASGMARSTSGAWDIGAYNSGSSGSRGPASSSPPPPPPSSNPSPVPTAPPSSSCTAQSFAMGSISVNPVAVGGSFTVVCDYGVSADSISVSLDASAGSCEWTDFVGTAARFSCTASSMSGSFPVSCTLGVIVPRDYCPQTNSLGNLQVGSSVPKPTPVPTPKPTPVPTPQPAPVPPSSCTTQSFASGSISVNPVAVGDSFTVVCDYGVSADSISVSLDASAGSCEWTDFVGTAARFSCTAGSTSGSFPVSCTLGVIVPRSYCPQTNSLGNLQVGSSTSAPVPSATPAPTPRRRRLR